MTKFTNQFVEFIPSDLQDGVLYVSMEYGTVVHRCCCGCGRKVVTPLAPHGWQLRYDGEAISLNPSVGNWQFPCRSHYWIRHGKADWIRDEDHDGGSRADESISAPFVQDSNEQSFWGWLSAKWRHRTRSKTGASGESIR